MLAICDGIKTIAIPLYISIIDVGVAWYVTTENSIHNIDIIVVETASAKEKLCSTFAKRPFKRGETIRIRCKQDIIGSVVKIRNRGRKRRALKLCGVKVYGSLGNAAIESSSSRCNY